MGAPVLPVSKLSVEHGKSGIEVVSVSLGKTGGKIESSNLVRWTELRCYLK